MITIKNRALPKASIEPSRAAKDGRQVSKRGRMGVANYSFEWSLKNFTIRAGASPGNR